MRSVALILALLSLSGCECCIADDSVIVIPVQPVPDVDDTPKPVNALADDELYVIASDVPLIVLASPVGVVSVESTDGPMTIRGRFAGGVKHETRRYTSKHLYLVESASYGTVELLIVPVGVSAETDVIRQVLTVSGGGPRPGPGPGPNPPEPTSDKLLISVLEDAQNRSPQTAICLNALAGWNALKDAGHDWRVYDDQTTEPKGKAALEQAAEAGQALPAMVVTDADTGKVLRVLPLPETIDGVKRVVSELTGE